MKKIIVIFSILFLTIFSGIFSVVQTAKTASFAKNQIEIIYNCLDSNDFKKLIKMGNDLKIFWNKKSKFLRLYMKREILEKIELEILKLQRNINILNKIKIYKNLSILHQYLCEMNNDVKLHICNIL